MAGRRNDRTGDEGQAPGLTWTRRGALAGGLALLPGLAHGAAAETEIPIRYAGGVPWTPVWLNKKGPYPFRVSSLSNTFMVRASVAAEAGLEQQAGEYGLTGGRQHRRVIQFYRARDMLVGGRIPMVNMHVPVLDAATERRDPDANNGPDTDFAGIVPVPADRITGFRWRDGVMRMGPALPEDIGSYGRVPLVHVDTAGFGWGAYVECRFAGKLVRMSLSTTSPHALTFNPDGVKRLGLWDASGPYYDRRSRFIDDDIEVRVRRASGDLELGGVRIERPVIGLRDPQKVHADISWADGTVGMDVLRRYDVVFDPRKDNAWLRPTEQVQAPWIYDRAGFQVEKPAASARVARVDPGSPAEQAGLKAGDVIGTNADNVVRLMAAQSMPAGTKIELPVLRDGQKMRIAIVNAERL